MPRSFWSYVREREAIRVAREAGRPKPWTRDLVLACYSFGNVERRRNPDTVRALELIANARTPPHEVLLRAYALRALNRLETFERHGLPTARTLVAWIKRIDRAYERGETLGARQHLTFWSHARLALGRLTPEVAERVFAAPGGVEAVRVLAAHRPTLYVGPYLGAQIVGDLALLGRCAFGRDPEVPVANGARVGLELALGRVEPREAHALFAENGTPSRDVRRLSYATAPDVLAAVRKLARASERRCGLRLTFADVETNLCEYGRYRRLAAGLDGHWRGRIAR